MDLRRGHGRSRRRRSSSWRRSGPRSSGPRSGGLATPPRGLPLAGCQSLPAGSRMPSRSGFAAPRTPALAARRALVRDPRAAAPGGAVPRPDAVPARPRPDRPLEAVPPAQGEDAGLHRPGGDHFRTRMTHTLETTAISRVVARALRLNEDLVEAIGLGHDMGHTPFGHAGEEALDEALAQPRPTLPPQRAVAGDRRAAEPDRRGPRRDPHAHRRRRSRGRSRGRSSGSSTASPTSTTTSTTRSATGS